MKAENELKPIFTVPIPPKGKDKKPPKAIIPVPIDPKGKKAIFGDEEK